MLILPVKEIVFDAYGTLFDVEYVSHGCENAYPGNGHRISDKWRRLQLERTWLLSLMHRYADFEIVTKNALELTLDDLNLTYNKKIVEDLFSLYLRLRTFPDVEKALKQLKGSTRLAILSNGTAKMLSELILNTGLGSYFTRVLSADAVQTYKPDPRVYGLVMEDNRFSRKDEILFVSANEWDVAGSKAFGFKNVHIKRRDLDHRKERAEFSPDYQVSNLDRLKSLL